MKELAGALLLLFMSQASGKAIPWQGEPFFIYSRGMKVTNLLNDLGVNYGIPVVVSPEINEKFSGKIVNKTPDQILSELAGLYNITWYYDGDILYFYKTQSIKREFISPDGLSTATLIKYLKQSGVPAGKNCAVQAISRLNAIEVTGVPICIERVASLTKMLSSQVRKQNQNKETVKVFQLKYASAADSTYQYRDQQVKLPGLVSVLREMSAGNNLSLAGAKESGDEPASMPLFSADPRQNAVIIRDRQANMPLYSSLITQLDQRPVQIEISVTIIDVDAGDISQLGIDWSASTSIGGAGVSFNSGETAPNSDGFSTVIGNTGNFMVRLNALQKNSRARVLSRPSVVTLNNIQAVLDKNVTFYTKLQGDKVAKLESITSGSLLRVTPRMIDSDGVKEVLLNLNIQDGQQQAPLSSSEPLPEIQNSDISTQATLRVGQSLLLGGFIQDKQIESQNKIPLLGDIPLLGGLFRSTNKQSHSVVRLFLIKAVPVNTGE
ncbi:TPA: EscC/YscC/HrcC family type III secretion system outer membrane ring protein [Yersinia enterocolitica]|uniref:EscC/YscC/HrcC family type III secretion system outer membrane ring protein n=1 Tax=Yersinia enterocolitica TaxID=630 RepID=UPI002813A059|nr:EscC/YscC/HrcC family type III secretion system outer membrane ring protein [Yersinia enterocolitica]EKN6097114.1 EscC/YscC/HrcC family type III secretion system outer membrane ring protein [Yersinia enterocolitica]HDL6750111.1 EscC/YscC/HrcC family type III secretion system outer membrane ring protein [Yersinia enterocolitica]HDL7055982.1 EscC/YscC/HrcC family type III secretion system outer membrane ring protein [Yersinia enterocolitica]HDL7876574.1 EscC/YscC/HrcC family type III secretion